MVDQAGPLRINVLMKMSTRRSGMDGKLWTERMMKWRWLVLI